MIYTMSVVSEPSVYDPTQTVSPLIVKALPAGQVSAYGMMKSIEVPAINATWNALRVKIFKQGTGTLKFKVSLTRIPKSDVPVSPITQAQTDFVSYTPSGNDGQIVSIPLDVDFIQEFIGINQGDDLNVSIARAADDTYGDLGIVDVLTDLLVEYNFPHIDTTLYFGKDSFVNSYPVHQNDSGLMLRVEPLDSNGDVLHQIASATLSMKMRGSQLTVKKSMLITDDATWNLQMMFTDTDFATLGTMFCQVTIVLSNASIFTSNMFLIFIT